MNSFTKEQRHNMMSGVHSKDTKPEILVRKYLWANGFRYRLNHPRLPGKPDIVMRKYRTCIFVNGCFWHGHNVVFESVISTKNNYQFESSPCCRIPKTNCDFWVKKIIRNQERDRIVQQKLSTMGWHTIVIWECQLEPKRRESTLSSLSFTLNHIYLKDRTTNHYVLPEEEHILAAEEETR